jgi:molybdopterin synthase sulfur carrier subunit
MAVLFIPSSLRRYTNEESKVVFPATNIAEILERFVSLSAELRNHLFTGSVLRKFVVVCKNGQDIRLLDGLHTPVDDQDEVRIVASVAGG